MTLRGYYLRAAEFQRKLEQAQRYYKALSRAAERRGNVVVSRAEFKYYRELQKRIDRVALVGYSRMLMAQAARHDARDRMYYDPWEAAREHRRQEFIRRNWS